MKPYLISQPYSTPHKKNHFSPRILCISFLTSNITDLLEYKLRSAEGRHQAWGKRGRHCRSTPHHHIKALGGGGFHQAVPTPGSDRADKEADLQDRLAVQLQHSEAIDTRRVVLCRYFDDRGEWKNKEEKTKRFKASFC